MPRFPNSRGMRNVELIHILKLSYDLRYLPRTMCLAYASAMENRENTGGGSVIEDGLGACPFCGDAVAAVFEHDYQRWSVVCLCCGATGPVLRSRAAAVARWEVRAPPSS